MSYQSTEVLQLSSTEAASASQSGLPLSTTSPAVLASAASFLHTSPAAATAAAGEVSYSLDPATGLVYVSAADRHAAPAERYAAAFAEAYISALHERDDAAIASLQQESRALASRIAALTRQQKGSAGPLVTAELAAASQSYGTVQSQIVALQVAPPPATVYAQASPASRSATSEKKLLAIAVLVGLLAGTGLALVRNRFDKRLRAGADVALEAPVLAELPFARKLDPRRHVVPVIDEPSSVLADRVRELRTTLAASLGAAQGGDGAAVVLVTSPQPGDGKSFLTANLAASWALSGRRTVAVSTDLRRPRLDTLLGVPSSLVGLSTLTTVAMNGAHVATEPRAEPASSDSDEAVVAVRAVLGVRPSAESVRAALVETRVAGLWLLPTGPSVNVDPGDLLASVAMREVILQLREAFDYVVIDTPAVESVADAGALAHLADGVVVVARAKRTSRDTLRDTIVRLTSAGATISGVVMNLTTQSRSTPSGYYLAERRTGEPSGQTIGR